MPRSLLAGACVALILLSACTRATPPDEALPPADAPAPPPSEEGLVQDTTRAAFERYRARWQEASGAYTFTFERNCFCAPDYRGPFVVTVREGSVVEASREGTEVPAGDERIVTIEALYRILEDGMGRADAVQVAYDTVHSIPATFYLDYDFQAADEEVGYRIVHFERID